MLAWTCHSPKDQLLRRCSEISPLLRPAASSQLLDVICMASRKQEAADVSDKGQGSSYERLSVPLPRRPVLNDDIIENAPQDPPSQLEASPLLHSRSKDLEIEYAVVDQLLCRICLDSGGDDLIAPCRCRGTQKYVHRSCLDNWRAAKEGFAFSHCTECRATFHLRANVPPDRWWRRLKFQLLVMRDHAAIIITVQLVVAFLGLMVYMLYGEELKEMFGYAQHPYGFYSLAVIVAILSGLSYGFFVSIICGQRISNRHYHVLAKRELSQEYVVQTLNDGDEPPQLDPMHVSELKRLGLY